MCTYKCDIILGRHLMRRYKLYPGSFLIETHRCKKCFLIMYNISACEISQQEKKRITRKSTNIILWLMPWPPRLGEWRRWPLTLIFIPRDPATTSVFNLIYRARKLTRFYILSVNCSVRGKWPHKHLRLLRIQKRLAALKCFFCLHWKRISIPI